MTNEDAVNYPGKPQSDPQWGGFEHEDDPIEGKPKKCEYCGSVFHHNEDFLAHKDTCEEK